jgi:hypothetical protein
MTGSSINAITTGILIGVSTLLIVWDVVLTRWKGAKTESRLLANWARDWTVIPYAWGVLGGHWFWFWETSVPDEMVRVAFYIVLSVLLLALDIAFYRLREAYLFIPPKWVQYIRHPLVALVLGVLVGHYLWGQRTLSPFPLPI